MTALITHNQTVQMVDAATGPISEEPAKRVVLADRYKTKLCNKFLEKGKCPYDRKCMFAHGEHELRTYEMNMMDGLTTEDSIRLFRIQQRVGGALPQRPRPDVVVVMGNAPQSSLAEHHYHLQGAPQTLYRQHHQCSEVEHHQIYHDVPSDIPSSCYYPTAEGGFHHEVFEAATSDEVAALPQRSETPSSVEGSSSSTTPGVYYYYPDCPTPQYQQQQQKQQQSSFDCSCSLGGSVGCCSFGDCEFTESQTSSSGQNVTKYRYEPYSYTVVDQPQKQAVHIQCSHPVLTP